jgi:hypothetical protein
VGGPSCPRRRPRRARRPRCPCADASTAFGHLHRRVAMGATPRCVGDRKPWLS